MKRLWLAVGSAAGLAACGNPVDLGGVVTRVDHGFDADALTYAVAADGERLTAAVSGALHTVWVADHGVETTWSLGESGAGIAVGDFDGDGRLDVATALPDSGAAAVMLQRDGWATAPVRKIAVGRGARAVLAVQLDADAADELVVADAIDGTVHVIDEMVAGPAIVVGPGPQGLAAGDLDGDGDQDVAVALADVDRAQLLLGTGAGELTIGSAYAVGAAPIAVVIAELDGEAGLDVATLDALGATVSVLHGDGAGGLRGPDTFVVPAQSTAMTTVQRVPERAHVAVLSPETGTVMEIDVRDGSQIRGHSGANKAVAGFGAVLWLAGPDRMMDAVPGPGLQFVETWTGPWVHAVAAVDIDGDGIDEAVGAIGQDGQIGWWRDGEKLGELDPGLGGVFSGMQMADVDADGSQDLVTWHNTAIAVAYGDSGGSFAPGETVRYGLAAAWRRQIVIGDVDDDGVPEVLALEPQDRIEVLQVNAARELVRIDEVEAESIYQLRTLDVGGAGLDLMQWTAGKLLVSDDWRSLPSREVPYGLEIADVDADGRLDAVSCPGSQLQIRSDLFGPGPITEISTEIPYGNVIARDVDRDGDVDLVVDRSWGQAPWYVELWLRDADEFQRRLGDVVAAGTNDLEIDATLAHLGGDGWIDVLLRDPNGHVAVRRGVPGMALGSGETLSVGGGRGDVFVDLDGDGAIDVVSLGVPLLVARGDGRGGWHPAQTHFIGGGAPSAVVVDVDGDGRDELVVLVGTMLVRIVVDHAGVVKAEPILRAPGGERLAAGDVDGDGAMDLVALASNYAWVSRGRGDGTFVPPVEQTLVVTTPKLPRLIDSDGDGRSELVWSIKGLWRSRWIGGKFEQSPEFWLGEGFVQDFAVGDVDGDLAPEVALAFGQTSAVIVLPGRAGPSSALRMPGELVFRVAIGDVDGDGARELVVLSRPFTATLGALRLQIGWYVSGGWVLQEQEIPSASWMESLELRDIDGDGAEEIVIGDGHGVTIVRLP